MITEKLIETDRLILRPFILDDAKYLAEISADPEVMRYIGGGPQSYEKVEQRVKSFIESYSRKNYSLFAIIEKDSGEFIGFCGLIDQTIDGEDFVELGYRLSRSSWNKKIATEAAMAVKEFAFNKLHLPQLISIIQTGNKPSIRVAEKVGMLPRCEINYHGDSVIIYLIKNNDALGINKGSAVFKI